MPVFGEMRSFLIIGVAACGAVGRSNLASQSSADCEGDAMAAAQFHALERDRVRIEFLPGTAADREAESILARRIDARDRISRALGVHDDRTLVVRLTPSRAAARAHHVEAGVAYPEDARIEALYLDGDDSYERVRYGHEVTHVLTWLLDPKHGPHFKLIDEGLAEAFDQSGRDLTAVFANELLATDRTVADATAFNNDDVFGRNYAKAGSFVQMLLALDSDPAKLARFYARCRWDTDFDASGLTARIDANLVAVYGIDLAGFRARWTAALERARERGPVLVSQRDADELSALLAKRDRALAERDPSLLAETTEHFYCSGSARNRWVLANVPSGHSTLVRAFDTGIKNYSTAVLVVDKEIGGRSERVRGYAEHFPTGWRLVK